MLYMVIFIGAQKFAIEAQDIQSIADFSHWTHIAGANTAMVGLASRRSQIITLLRIDGVQSVHDSGGDNGALQPPHADAVVPQRVRAMIIAHNGYDYGIMIGNSVDSRIADSDDIMSAGAIAPMWKDMIGGLVSIDREFVPVLDVHKTLSVILARN